MIYENLMKYLELFSLKKLVKTRTIDTLIKLFIHAFYRSVLVQYRSPTKLEITIVLISLRNTFASEGVKFAL